MPTTCYNHVALLYVFDYGPWLVGEMYARPVVWPLAGRFCLWEQMRVTQRPVSIAEQSEYRTYWIPITKRSLTYYRPALRLVQRIREERDVQTSTDTSKS